LRRVNDATNKHAEEYGIIIDNAFGRDQYAKSNLRLAVFAVT
jgi:hypothetical protein